MTAETVDRLDLRFWHGFPIADGADIHWDIGQLHLWARRCGKEWRLWHEHSSAAELRPPEDAVWRRWITPAPPDGTAGPGERPPETRLYLRPALPDRPVVARPDSPLFLAADVETLFFVSIPLWVAVHAHAPDGHRLTALPSIVLSNTWFGEPTAGELCYSLKILAAQDYRDLPAMPHRATCPVRLCNDHDETLDVERVCLRVGHLPLYAGATRLWTGELQLHYRGPDYGSHLTYPEAPPAFETMTPLSPAPELPDDVSLLRNYVSRLAGRHP